MKKQSSFILMAGLSLGVLAAGEGYAETAHEGEQDRRKMSGQSTLISADGMDLPGGTEFGHSHRQALWGLS